MRGQCVGGELVLAGGQQPSGTDTSRSTTNSRSSGGRSPTTQLPARVGHRLSGRLNDGGSPRGVGRGRRGQQRDRRTVPGAADGAVPGPPTGPQLDHVRAGRRAAAGGPRAAPAALAEPASFTAPPVLSPAQYESAGKRRDGSISPHSLQRVWRRSASTKRSTSRSLRPIPARIAHRSLLRATARTLDDPAGRRDGPAPPRGAGMTLP